MKSRLCNSHVFTKENAQILGSKEFKDHGQFQEHGTSGKRIHVFYFFKSAEKTNGKIILEDLGTKNIEFSFIHIAQ
jgi:hypothetical protein